MLSRTFITGTLLCLAAGSASASVVPFTETFSAGHANWGGGGQWQNFEPLAWSASGGPKNAGFVSTTLDLAGFDPGSFPALTLFRGQDNYNSSSGAFVGNWIESGIMQFSFWVRHDGPADLLFSVRFTPVDANSPSMNFEFTNALVASNTWTQLTLDISPDTPGWVVGGGPGTYNSVFGNLGKIQIGADLAPLAGLETEVTFDLSKVAIAVPTPGALAVLALGAVGLRRRRRP